MLWKLVKGLFRFMFSSSSREQGSSEPAETEQSAGGLTGEQPEDFVVIPVREYDPRNGDFHKVWGALLELENIYFPVFVNFEKFAMTPENARPLRMEDLDEQYLFVQSDAFGNGMELFDVMYTDTRNLGARNDAQGHEPCIILGADRL